MPAFTESRQVALPAVNWLTQAVAVPTLQQIHADLGQELSSVYGDIGIMIMPQLALADLPTSVKLARLLRLHRSASDLDGDVRCSDLALPFAPSSLSLVYVLCGLELSVQPEIFLDSLIRSLRPQGKLVLVTLNPVSLLRTRYFRQTGQIYSGRRLAADLHRSGMQINKTQFIGPLWSIKSATSLPEPQRPTIASRLRLARVIIAERREPGMTPIRLRHLSPKVRTNVAPGLNGL